MSLHVVPRQSAQVPIVEDDERTALDDGDAMRKAAAEWEDGTTVEESTIAQGKSYRPQDKSFDGGGSTTSTTNTAGQTIDELTVEEQARPLPPLQLVRATEPPATASKAKLVVLSGTDLGREFEVLGGRTILVGRATDNDVVLTDISVSRKHFELLYEADHWILRDRGSGNGTLINDRLEDGSCQLQDGDRIEIGNTSFRFDHAASVQRPSRVGWGQRDEEARTVAGKISREHPVGLPEMPVDPRPATTLQGAGVATRRAVRSRTNSGPLAPSVDVPGLPPVPPGVLPGAANAPTLAPQMYPVIPPVSSPAAPTMAAYVQPEPGHLVPSGVLRPSDPFRPALAVDVISPVAIPPPRPSGARYALIASVAIVVTGIGIGAAALGSSPVEPARPQIATPRFKKLPFKLTKPVEPAPPPPTTKTTTVPAPVPPPAPPPSTITSKPIPALPPAPPPTPPPPQVASVTPAPVQPSPPPPVPVPSADDTAKQEAEAKAAADRKKQQQEADAKAEADRKKQQQEADAKAEADRKKQQEADAKAEDARKQRKAEEQSRRAEADREQQRKREEAAERRAEERRKQREAKAAEASSSSSSSSSDGGAGATDTGPDKGAIDKANGQYQGGDFRGAASTLTTAATKTSGSSADELRAQAANYRQIGDGITYGKTKASSSPIDALAKLKIALDADRKAGGVHKQTIRDLLQSVAPKAAIAQMVANNYEAAFRAANDADGYGASASVASVRRGLSAKAQELTQNGQKLLASDPVQGKQLLNRVIRMVPKDNVWYLKAQKLLTGG